ncbi:MAG TPA: hypothetical protein PKL91_08800 [Bacteroidales bacterium]|nr:hypothetical protein [Bacteroidales bacterium]
MRKSIILILILITILTLTACTTKPSEPTSVLPVVTNAAPQFTSTPFFVPSSTPTLTHTPKPTQTPLPTLDPMIPLRIPDNGDDINSWGWGGYQVWASNNPLVSCWNGDVTDFICGDNPNINMYFWDSEQPWFFAGQATLSSNLSENTFNFDQPYVNFVITADHNREWAIDSIYGILEDGTEIPFGYAMSNGDLVAVPLYWDTPKTPIDNILYYIELEKQNQAPATISDCGVVGKLPDESVIVVHPGQDSGSAILFRMLNSPTAWGGHRGEQAYQLIGLKIIAGKYSSKYRVCPE